MSEVAKSYSKNVNSVGAYCSKLTVKQHPLQKELTEVTLKDAEMSMMLGAPEVLTLGANFIELIKGNKCLDIGCFTGASALAWALATGDSGKVYTFDVNLDNYKKFGLPIISKCPKTLAKIEAIEGPALEYLDKLIADGQSGTFDFAFIDADKINYPNYYDRCVTLLRSGGVILVDNSLWSGRVVNYSPDDKSTAIIDQTNHQIFADDRTNSALINCGDGTHLAFKK